MKQTTIKLDDSLWELLHINAIKLRLSFNDYVVNIIKRGMENDDTQHNTGIYKK